MNKIPTFLNTNNLTITRTHNSNKDGRTQELTAVDGEGDQVTVSKWTENVGAAAVMPETRLTVSYQERGHEASEARGVGSDEAYRLGNALSDAEQVDNLDSMTVNWLISDLQMQGGGGGGACSL